MTGMAFEAELGAQGRRLGDPLQLGLLGLPLDLAVAAGVQFDDRRTQRDRGLQLAGVGLDEQRDADAGIAQARDQGLQVVVLTGGVEPALGGPLLALLRHDAGGVRPVAQRDADHLLGRRHPRN